MGPLVIGNLRPARETLILNLVATEGMQIHHMTKSAIYQPAKTLYPEILLTP